MTFSAQLTGTKISLIALALLLVGYFDLVRGGITLSAISLTVAYCVLIPWAIWTRSTHAATEKTAPAPAAAPPSYKAAAVAGFLVFLLYLVTLAPGTAMWDASEYIAAAWTFGVPHPPGNPFFVVVGRVFSILPLPLSIATKVNIFAATASAVSASMWFLVAEKVARSWLREKWQGIAVGAVAAIVGATAFTVWNQSVVNEKVYTFSLLGIAIISWLAIRWLDNPRGSRADALLIVIAYLCGLGYANHAAGMLAAPAVAFATLIRDWRAVLRPRLLAACAGALLVGVSPFLTQPIRAGHNPPINEGGVSACVTEFRLSCTFSGTTLDRFLYNLNRGQYSKPSVFERQAPFVQQVLMWWQYFEWQWLRDPFFRGQLAQSFLAAAFFVLALTGAWTHYKQHRESFLYFGPLMFIMTLGLIFYLNFKYGYSQVPDLGNDVPREVRERDYFYIWSFSALSVWVATGLATAWTLLATAIQKERGRQSAAREKGTASVEAPTRRGWMLASPVLLVALIPLVTNFSAASRHDDRATAAWARDILNSLEPYAILIVGGDNDTFPLWYAQEVENVRKDVVVANTSLLGTDWHPRQIITRPLFDFDANAAAEIFRNGDWKKPATPALNMSIEEADAVPEVLTPVRPMTFEAHGISATVDPAALDYRIITRSDVMVLHMIRHSSQDRPIYFSRSMGPYASQLGLGDHFVTQGLADKLVLPALPESATAPPMKVDGMGIFDFERTRTLWEDVYQAPDAIVGGGYWVDEPSVNIPILYVTTAAELSHLLFMKGDTTAAYSVFDQGRRIAESLHVPGLVERLNLSRPR